MGCIPAGGVDLRVGCTSEYGICTLHRKGSPSLFGSVRALRQPKIRMCRRASLQSRASCTPQTDLAQVSSTSNWSSIDEKTYPDVRVQTFMAASLSDSAFVLRRSVYRSAPPFLRSKLASQFAKGVIGSLKGEASRIGCPSGSCSYGSNENGRSDLEKGGKSSSR